MSRVSIILPTFNRGWVVERAIKSVLDQTFDDFELIIVNDGSVDDTSERLTKITDPRVKLIDLKENSGLSHARNIGLKSAKGDLIAYLDSDNLWYNNYLQISVDAFKDDIVMVYSGQNLLLVGGQRNDLKTLGYKTRNEKYNPEKLVSEGNFIDVNCVVHKKDLLDDVGYFDESLKILEDWDMFAQVAIKYPFKIKHIDQVLSEYYFIMPETDASLTNQKWQKWVEEFFAIDQKEGDELAIKNKIKKLLT